MVVNSGTNISTMKEGDRQQQRAVDPLLLVVQVHEHRRHHRPLDARDDERDGDRRGHREVTRFAATVMTVNTSSAAPIIR